MPQTLVRVTCQYCGRVFEKTLALYNQAEKLGRNHYCSRSHAKIDNPTPEQDLIHRFWSKVKKTDTCWIWKAGKKGGGYGSFYYKGHRISASRFSYILHYGEVSDELEVLHKCDNPPCVRPDHLRAGNHLENMQDMAAKRRGGSNPNTRGETNPTAKLKLLDVIVIRVRLAKGDKHRDIARDYHVARTTITAINQGKNWRL